MRLLCCWVWILIIYEVNFTTNFLQASWFSTHVKVSIRLKKVWLELTSSFNAWKQPAVTWTHVQVNINVKCKRHLGIFYTFTSRGKKGKCRVRPSFFPFFSRFPFLQIYGFLLLFLNSIAFWKFSSEMQKSI